MNWPTSSRLLSRKNENIILLLLLGFATVVQVSTARRDHCVRFDRFHPHFRTDK